MGFGALPKWFDEKVFFIIAVIGSKNSGANEMFKILFSEDFYGKENEHHQMIHIEEEEKNKDRKIEMLLDVCSEDPFVTHTILVLHSLNGIASHLLSNLFFNHRHYGISVIFKAPALEFVYRGDRRLVTHFVLFNPCNNHFPYTSVMLGNASEFVLQTLLFPSDREFQTHETKNRELLRKRVKECWDVPYQFLLMDNMTNNLGHRYHIGLEKPLLSPEDLKQLIITYERETLDTESH